MDVNHDGKISPAELVVGLSIVGKGSIDDKLELLFKSFDMDGDGKVSKEDFEARLTSGMQYGLSFLKGQDSSTSQKLEDKVKETKTLSRIVKLAFEVDLDKDGYLSLSEWKNGATLHNNAILTELLKFTDLLSLLRHYSSN
eukprot:TRINITY_DN2304_c0_g1_i2.p1 TRINITY_DN2304_c0_g1~~TRINITY_DN2304_c0_g1_i2.p1  ORF type:complete len:141 (+),score=24.63 TRINITY_DN2304_c0_g1_i2:414-836(+)